MVSLKKSNIGPCDKFVDDYYRYSTAGPVVGVPFSYSVLMPPLHGCLIFSLTRAINKHECIKHAVIKNQTTIRNVLSLLPLPRRCAAAPQSTLGHHECKYNWSPLGLLHLILWEIHSCLIGHCYLLVCSLSHTGGQFAVRFTSIFINSKFMCVFKYYYSPSSTKSSRTKVYEYSFVPETISARSHGAVVSRGYLPGLLSVQWWFKKYVLPWYYEIAHRVVTAAPPL